MIVLFTALTDHQPVVVQGGHVLARGQGPVPILGINTAFHTMSSIHSFARPGPEHLFFPTLSAVAKALVSSATWSSVNWEKKVSTLPRRSRRGGVVGRGGAGGGWYLTDFFLLTSRAAWQAMAD